MLDRSGVRVLVVDDSTTVQRLMDLTLRPLGVDVEFADNGRDAISLAQRRYYDLIFLDVILPEVDGYRVCRTVKGNKNTKGTPIIMLTSQDSVFDKVRGIMAGTDVYLTKPLDRPKLIAALKKYIPGMETRFQASTLGHANGAAGV